MSTDSPASPDFPDVELITGSLTWRVWSTDPDNPGGVGDIGVISSPHPENFAVAILDPSDGAGARDVKAIRLAPSSAGNYSNVTGHPVVGSVISGTLMDELVVQADGSGAGGEVALSIGSLPSTAHTTIHKLNYLNAHVVSGTIDVDELVGNATLDIFSGTLNIATAIGDGAIVRIFAPTAGYVTVSEMGSGFHAFIAEGVAQSGVLTFGEFLGSATMMIGQGVGGGSEVAGHVHFLNGIPQDVEITVLSELTSTGVIDLLVQPTDGMLKLHGGGSGSVYGGAVRGIVELGFGSGYDTGFAGAAQFTTLKAGGTIAIAGDLDGSVLLTETNAGELTVSGDLSASGEIEVYESLIGSISILGDAVGEITFGDGGAGSVSVDGHISGPLLI